MVALDGCGRRGTDAHPKAGRRFRRSSGRPRGRPRHLRNPASGGHALVDQIIRPLASGGVARYQRVEWKAGSLQIGRAPVQATGLRTSLRIYADPTMKVLVLGGTVFLSREVAVAARDRGHEVTCAARGVSGGPPHGVRFVRIDRAAPKGLAPLAGERFDAVVDVARQSVTQVRAALQLLGGQAGHWTFVSTRSVYADKSTPNQTASAALVAPADSHLDEDDPENYGRLKVAAEQAVLDALGGRVFVTRPGLIAGRGDVSDRYGYWPARLSMGGEVLCPGDPSICVQLIDVRDVAAWIVLAAEEHLTGVYDATGPPLAFQELLSRTKEAALSGEGTEAELTWVASDFLSARGVTPWSGERSLPLWLPQPELASMGRRDVSPSLAAGLVVRPVEEMAADALEWERRLGLSRHRTAGITRSEETALLDDWRVTRRSG